MFDKEITANELIVSIDWISFTVKVQSSLSDILSRFGLSISQFREMPRGLNGYRSQLRHDVENNGFIRVLYDGAVDMGVHIDITGTAVSYALQCFKDSRLRHTPFGDAYEIPFDCTPDNMIRFYLQSIRDIADITRFDTAIDDFGTRYFSVSDVRKLIDNRQLVSPLRSHEYIIKASNVDGQIMGDTVYIGSKKSDLFIRIYDKGLEQNKNVDWVRWELQVRDAKANAYVDELVHTGRISTVAVGVLSRYVRFVVLDDSNRSRCSTLSRWSDFIGEMNAIRLSIPEKSPSVDAKREWIYRQVLPTIAGLMVAYAGDIGAVLGDLEKEFLRLPADLQSMFLEYAHRGKKYVSA